MATPLEQAVVDAARAWAKKMQEGAWDGVTGALLDAIVALDAAPATTEQEITWGLLVSQDEIYSPKVGKWFEVLEIKTQAGVTTARLRGVAKPFVQPAATPVRVRRSDMGKAVDMFTIDWSGPRGAS